MNIKCLISEEKGINILMMKLNQLYKDFDTLKHDKTLLFWSVYTHLYRKYCIIKNQKN